MLRLQLSYLSKDQALAGTDGNVANKRLDRVVADTLRVVAFQVFAAML